MNASQQVLSDLVIFNKYARFRPDLKRRETWEEIVSRYVHMMMTKYGTDNDVQLWQWCEREGGTDYDAEYFSPIAKEIFHNSKYLYEKKVLPSMRAAQFAGEPVSKNNARLYNCFSRGTQFITSQGLKSFWDFEDGQQIRVLTHKGRWRNAVVKNHGVQPLNAITFARGRSKKTVKATPNHTWLLKNGSRTQALAVGNMLQPAPSVFAEFNYRKADPLERLYWAYGYVYGDGTRVKDAEGVHRYSMVRLCGKDKNLYQERFEELGFNVSSSHSLGGDVICYTKTYLKTAPNPTTDSPALIRAFVRGYLDADGAKDTNENPDNFFRSIQSSDTEHQRTIEQLFAVAGVYVLSKKDKTGQVTNYGTRPETYQYGLYQAVGKAGSGKWSVSSIEEAGQEEVWCLEVEEDHSFILAGGIVTGNCSFLPVDDPAAFSEIMFLLLGGTGVGYSVQQHHVAKLPAINKGAGKPKKFLIGDSIEGWADAVKALMYWAFGKRKNQPVFDFSDIRPKGSRLVTAGGKAPGPAPLRVCLAHIQGLLDGKQNGERLSSLEVHDVICYIADSVLAGGIRRAALIALFSPEDDDMVTCKDGNWWELNPQRGRANNSAVLLRETTTQADFQKLWDRISASYSGEPGIYFTNELDWGTNPCCEIALRPFQFCNL